MSAFWNTGLHARRQYASETDCDRTNLHRSSVVLCSLIQIAELLSKFHFVLHIYQAALSKLVSKFRLKRSTLPQRYKNFVTLHPSKQKLQLKKVGVTARILSSAAYSDSPLPVTTPTSVSKRYLYPASSLTSPEGRRGNVWTFRSPTHLVFPPHNICSDLTNSPTSFIPLSLVQSSEA